MFSGARGAKRRSAVGVSPATVRKWLRRHESEGVAGLQDRTYSLKPLTLYRTMAPAEFDRPCFIFEAQRACLPACAYPKYEVFNTTNRNS